MTKEQETEIIQRVYAGDSRAENELFSQFDSRIVRKVRLSIGTKNEDWQDIVSEIQVALLNNLREGKFDVERGVSLGTYVFGITMNKIRDYFKFRKKQEIMTPIQPEEHDLSVPEDPDIEGQEIRTMLRQLLEKLKMQYKEVLYLRYYEELSVAEISQKINLPPRRVSERINYAVKLLQKECQKQKFFSIFQGVLIILI